MTCSGRILGTVLAVATCPLFPACGDATPDRRERPSSLEASEAGAIAARVANAHAAQRWREAIESGEARARLRAAETWAESGLEPGVAAAALVPLLADPDTAVRRLATTALIGMGAAAIEPLRTLGLASRDEELPFLAMDALGAIASGGASAAADALLAALNQPRVPREHRAHAANVLGQIRPIVPAVRAALVGMTADADTEVATGAVQGLGRMGAGAEPAVPALLALLDRVETEWLAPEVVRALRLIPGRPDVVVPALAAHLPRLQSLPQEEVQAALAAGGKAALPHHAAALGQPTVPGTYLLLLALAAIGPDAAPMAEAVTRAMAQSASLDYAGSRALEGMGPAARRVAGSLGDATVSLEAQGHDLTYAYHVLIGFGAEGHAALFDVLQRGVPNVRISVLQILGHQLPKDPRTRPRLVEAAERDPDREVRRSAKRILEDLKDR